MELWQRFTAQLRRIVLTAHDMAQQDGVMQISSAHLCRGLLMEHSTHPQVVPEGVDREALEGQLRELEASDEKGETKAPSFTPEAQRVLLRALKAAKEANSVHVGAEHLVAGLLREAEVGSLMRAAGFG